MRWKHRHGKCDGVITGCDSTLEWMLPWWWFNYSLHNSYPILFLDFGMTKKGNQWCKEHGTVIKIKNITVSEKCQISTNLLKIWNKRSKGKRLWFLRKIWFRKPLGLLKTPFARSIWLDLDCEVNGSLYHLFPLCENESGMAILEEPELIQACLTSIKSLQPKEKSYNSGVVVYRHLSSLVFSWAKRSFAENHLFLGDQDVLSRVIFEGKISAAKLPPSANWFVDFYGTNAQGSKEALISHYRGSKGKELIMQKNKEIQDSFLSLTLDSKQLCAPENG